MDGSSFLVGLLGILGSILLIMLIVLCVRGYMVLNKVDVLIDDMQKKMQQMDSFFGLLDTTADRVTRVSDFVVNGVMSFLSKLFKKRKGDNNG